MSDPSIQTNSDQLQNSNDIPINDNNNESNVKALSDHKFFSVNIITPKNKTIQIQTSIGDNVQDLKQMLFEVKDICHITSYSLIYNGVEINDFSELCELPDLKEGSTFTMLEAPYTSFCSRIHIRRLRELLNNNSEKPLSLLSSLTTQLEELSNSRNSVDNQSNNNNNNNNSQKQNNNNQRKGRKKRKNNKKAKKQQQRNKPNQNNKNTNNSSSNINENGIFAPENLEIDNNLDNFYPQIKKTKIQCLHSLCYSGWNPPPGNRHCKGDLAYLIIKTLENNTYHVTSTCNGFYVSKSTNSKFDPLPADNSYFSHTLVELLESISPLFKSNYHQLLECYFSRHPYEVIPVLTDDFNLSWINSDEPHSYDFDRTQEFLSCEDLFRFPDQLRDWNAEYQSCKELPKETLQERIFRDRSIAKVTNEFVNAAVAGVKAIINGTVRAINPTDPLPAYLYIYNNIFFSYALNGRFLFDENEGDMGPYKLVSNDLRGVHIYNRLDLQDIHTVLTVLINYKGYRLVAQSIIPGILHQTSTTCIQYGSIDHGKTLAWSENFHKVMSKVAESLYIPEHEVEDEEGNKVKLWCSADTKGVLGTDGRKYVLDLDRTTVRDINFSSSWSILRLELYDIYFDWMKQRHALKYKDQYQKVFEKVMKKKKENNKNVDEKEENKKEIKDDENQHTEEKEEIKEDKTNDTNDTDDNDNNNDDNDDNDDKIPELIFPKFNPNAYDLRHGKFVGSKEEKELAENNIKDISNFLVSHVIPTLVNEFIGNIAYPSDSNTLCSIFHGHGINLRYLGKVTELLKNEKPFIKDLMVREMIVRSTKHIFNTAMRSFGTGQFACSVSDLLNCFIRGAFIRNFTNLNANNDNNDKLPEEDVITPQSLWKNIEDHVKEHFNYTLKKEEFQASEYIIPALRLLCQQTGIQLKSRSYDFYAHKPICEDDILDIFPVVKIPPHISADGNELIETGKTCLMKGRVDIAFECLTDALAIFHQTYGPMHPLTANCYSHLAMVLNHIGDHTQALIHQSKSIIILERTKGLDYYETAFEYSNLGLFYHQAKHAPLAFGFLKRSLYLSTLIGGTKHPDNTAILTNLAAILQDNKLFDKAINFYNLSLEGFEYHFGGKNFNISSTFHNIALCYAHLNNFRQALHFEKKSFEILQEIFGDNDPRTLESNAFINQFTSKAVQIEKEKITQPKLENSNAKTRGNDDDIGTLPIREILKYINNSEPRGRSHFGK